MVDAIGALLWIGLGFILGVLWCASREQTRKREERYRRIDRGLEPDEDG